MSDNKEKRAIEPWLLPVETWRSEYEELRLQVEEIVREWGRIPSERLRLWQRFQELADNRPVGAIEPVREGAISAPAAIQDILAMFPEEDLRFVRSIRIEGAAGELQDTLRQFGAPLVGRVNAWNAGGDIILSSRFWSAPLRSAIGRRGQLDLIAHEVGHTIYNHLPAELLRRWEEVHPPGSGIQFAEHAARIGEWNPTGLASESPAEDFAESYLFYRFGGIDPYLTEPIGDKVPGDPVRLGEMRKSVLSDVGTWLRGGRERINSISRPERKARRG